MDFVGLSGKFELVGFYNVSVYLALGSRMLKNRITPKPHNSESKEMVSFLKKNNRTIIGQRQLHTVR